MAIETINPSTGKKIRTHDLMSYEQLGEIVEKAEAAYQLWRHTDFAERSIPMIKAATKLEANKNAYAQLMAEEMGKPLAQGIGEIEKCARVCRYYAEYAEGFLKSEMISTDATKSYVRFQPLGIILAIMPWNFPFWQVFRFAAPALMAGNAALLKHAPNVTGCALAVEELMEKAGFPQNLFRALIIDNDQASFVIKHPLIKAVTLTGSTRAGRAVASLAGSVLKKTVLELGGSDPYVILEDADLAKTVQTCVASRMINGGQSCIAAKRFIVPVSLKERFEALCVEHMRSYKMGDPFKEGVQLGPLARFDLRDTLHGQVTRSRERGARLLLGGEIPKREGAFYPPTVLTNVTKGMPAYEEELFGPVAAIIKVKNEEEAMTVANDSNYGLGAAVFTKNVEKGERMAAEYLEAGCCFVNDFVRSDPRLPFGGVKESGFGRELSVFGLREFVNIKTVYVG